MENRNLKKLSDRVFGRIILVYDEIIKNLDRRSVGENDAEL